MVISDKNKYIFISVPKTGTRSIHKYLLEHDPTALKNKAYVNGKKTVIMEASTAQQIRDAVGKKNFKEYTSFGFIRNPYSKIVSAYYFYKNGSVIGNPSQPLHLKLLTKIKIIIAKTLPLKLWALIYPYKSNWKHLCDDKGKIIVDFVGDFDNLNKDFAVIIKTAGLPIATRQLPHVNKTKHDSYYGYFKNKFFSYLINKKINKDLKFYKKITSLNSLG